MSFQTKTRKTSPSRMSPHSLHTVSQPGSQCHSFSSNFIFCEVTLVISKLLFPVSICWTACLSLENKRTLFPGDRSHKKWHAVSSFQRKFLQNIFWTEAIPRFEYERNSRFPKTWIKRNLLLNNIIKGPLFLENASLSKNFRDSQVSDQKHQNTSLIDTFETHWDVLEVKNRKR